MSEHRLPGMATCAHCNEPVVEFRDDLSLKEFGISGTCQDEVFDTDPEDRPCGRCDGEGELLVCIDDLCRGAGECMHGDGMIVCPSCGGLG